MNSGAADVKGLFSFFQLCGKLKVCEPLYRSALTSYMQSTSMSLSLFPQHLKRTGWVNHEVKDPETVAGHMYRMAMMCFLFGTEDRSDAGSGKPLDRGRYNKLSQDDRFLFCVC